jgi:hypothetical protein
MWKPWRNERIHGSKTYIAPSWSPFALGYTMENQKPVSAKFEFATDYNTITEEYAKVVDTSCTAKGKDEMGAVQDGYLVLWTLAAKVYFEDAPV